VYDEKAAAARTRARRAAHLPDLSMFASARQIETLQNSPLNDSVSELAIGARLSMPIFTGFSDTYSVAHARAERQFRREVVNFERMRVQREVHAAYWEYATALKNYEIMQTILASAIENERVALGSYKAGTAPITVLMDAQNMLARARLQESAGLYECMIAKVRLGAGVGTLIKDYMNDWTH
jgi:outer membrane protein TolC